MRTATVPDLADRLAHATVRLARMLRQQDESAMTPTMRAALGTISRDGPLTLGELAGIEQVAPPTVTKVVGKLEDAGLVTRETDALDRRVVHVELSAAGRRWLDDDRRRRQAWLAGALQKLDHGDVETLTGAVAIMERLTAPEGER